MWDLFWVVVLFDTVSSPMTDLSFSDQKRMLNSCWERNNWPILNLSDLATSNRPSSWPKIIVVNTRYFGMRIPCEFWPKNLKLAAASFMHWGRFCCRRRRLKLRITPSRSSWRSNRVLRKLRKAPRYFFCGTAAKFSAIVEIVANSAFFVALIKAEMTTAAVSLRGLKILKFDETAKKWMRLEENCCWRPCFDMNLDLAGGTIYEYNKAIYASQAQNSRSEWPISVSKDKSRLNLIVKIPPAQSF